MSDHHVTHHHRLYRLTCEEFDALHAEAGGLCMRCGEYPTGSGRRGRLQIDHDHADYQAVRGLLCPRCNSRVGAAELGRKPMDVLTYRYLRTAWWRTHRPYCEPWVVDYAERYRRVAA